MRFSQILLSICICFILSTTLLITLNPTVVEKQNSMENQSVSLGHQATQESFTIVLEPVSDATINSLNPDMNFGDLNYNLSVQYYSSRQIQRCLIRFNIASAIPSNAIIDEANLHLYLNHNQGPDSLILTARCIIQDWIETQVTWNDQPQTGPPITTTYIITDSGYKEFNITTIVQAWHQVPHYGVELIGPEGETTYQISFHNRQQTGMNPYLEIIYHIDNDTQSSEGWCCHQEDIIISTQEDCMEMGGQYYETYEEAVLACSDDPSLNESDLIITAIWYDEDTIFYEILNNGDEIIQNDFSVALFINDEYIMDQLLTDPIEPYQPFVHYFEYSFECTSEDQIIRVWVDVENSIPESDENNNQHEILWACEKQALEIVSGPTLLEITQTSVIITWETNIPSDNIFSYGTNIGNYEREIVNATPTTYHVVHLSDLTPSTTYAYTIKSTTEFGQQIKIINYLFETLSIPDDTNPHVIIQHPGTIRGTQIITAEAIDDHGVERVEFYHNETLLNTDYTPPYELTFDSKSYNNGMHDINAKAYDTSNNEGHDNLKADIANLQDTTIPKVSITTPKNDQTISGSLDVHVNASDDTGLFYGQFMVDGNWSGNWYPKYEGAKNESFTFPFDTTIYSNGKHRIAFQIYDTEFNQGIGYQDIIINNAPTPQPPNLHITKREIEQTDNYFLITLTLKNNGGTTAENIRILDSHQLFQPIAKNSTEAIYNITFSPELTTWEIDITSKVTILPGKQQKYSYYLVPVLIPPISLQPLKAGSSISAIPPKNLLPIIGGTKYVDCTDLWYEPPDKSEIYYKRIPLSSIEVVKYNNACKSSDYLIVTSPRNLFKFNPDHDVNLLLSNMAELAQLKYGILGFLDPASQFSLNFEKHDKIAIGNLNTDPTDEIIIADKSADRIIIYSVEDKTLYYVSKTVFSPFHLNWWKKTMFKCGNNQEGFDDGDCIAVGQIGNLKNASIVMADSSADTIITYDEKGLKKHSFTVIFNQNDNLAIGDINNDGVGEIIIAQKTFDMISIYQPDGTPEQMFSVNLNPGDGIVVGDVIGDEKDEIIIADDNNDKIFLYNEKGKQISWFYYRYDNGDGLAVGNMIATWPYDKDEIIFGDPRGKDISILRGDGYELDWFYKDFHPYDGFSIGDFRGNGVCDVIIADQTKNFIDIHGLDQTTGNKYILSDLIKPYGSWSSKLTHNWTSNGYLLIVGETEIIPAWAGKNHGSVTTTKGKRSLQADVTDYPYANTIGEEIIPELANGRIIGNSAKDLCIPIKTSINVENKVSGYGYDHSDYFAVSGFSKGLSGGADSIDFQKELWEITKALHANKIYGVVMYTPDYGIKDSAGSIDQIASENAIEKKFFAHTKNHDIIFLTGHGNTGSWDAIGVDDVLVQSDPFGSTNPAVYAASCTTGAYHHGLSLAESMLKKGAGVYYGATKWGLGSHSWIHQKFFKHWTEGYGIGDVARDIKQSIADTHYGSYSYPDKKARYYSSIYHVFGDPKYGLDQNIIKASKAVKGLFSNSGGSDDSGTEKTLEIEITIPSYESESYEDQTYLFLPGGDLLMVENQPIVPYYQVEYQYPKSYHIQDVQLVASSEAETISNLILPITTEAIGYENQSPVLFGQNGTYEWWPPSNIDWSTYEDNDSSTLAIIIYPVQYHSDTNQAIFISSMDFIIDYVNSPIEITSIQTDKKEYEPAEPIQFDITLFNAEPRAQDVILSGSIKQENAEDILSGIPLITLNSLKHTSTYSYVINSTNLPNGYYEVEIEIRNHQGNILDHTYGYFKIGRPRAIITNLTAETKSYDEKTIIDISFMVENIGSSQVNGSASISADFPTNETIHQMIIDNVNISPSDSKEVTVSWEVTKVIKGTYQVTAMILYDGSTSPLKTIEVDIGNIYTSEKTPLSIVDLLLGLFITSAIVLYFRKHRNEH